ncbi:MAG TPA: hypothetical protein VF796_20855 [Humisphaera sp.]
MSGVKTSRVEGGMTVTFVGGVLQSEVPVDDTGTARHYHSNGILALEIPRKLGRNHGTSREWHDNGRPKSEAHYVYGMIVGVSREWDRDGSLSVELNHVVPDCDGCSAIHGLVHEDEVRVHAKYLWNGKPLSRERWRKKVLATGMTEAELEQRLAATQPAKPASGT